MDNENHCLLPTCSVLATGIAPAFTIIIRIIYPLGEVTNNRFIQVFDAGGRIENCRQFLCIIILHRRGVVEKNLEFAPLSLYSRRNYDERLLYFLYDSHVNANASLRCVRVFSIHKI